MSSSSLPPLVEWLLTAVVSAPSADNAQPWCFSWDGQVLSGWAHQRSGFPKDYHATRVAAGAAAENLVWALRESGLSPDDWQISPPEGETPFFCGTLPAEHLPSTPNHPGIWLSRHTSRVPYQPYLPDTFKLKSVLECREGSVSVQAFTGSAIDPLAFWIEEASAIRFQTREVNEWFAESVRYGNAPDEFRSGLHVQTLALPPGGIGLLRLMSDWRRMQLLNRLGMHRLFAKIEAANFRKAPLILALTGGTDSSAFDAGRCLQRVWLELTRFGLSAHPYYVVADLLHRLDHEKVPAPCLQQGLKLKQRVESALGSDQRLHCLLRVGVPAKVVPVSGRLPMGLMMCPASP